jgi:peptide deformylase
MGVVKRANYVRTKCLNREGKEIFLAGEGFLARCIQHEIDHLNGKLFIDHVEGNFLFHERKKQKIDLLEVIRLANAK